MFSHASSGDHDWLNQIDRNSKELTKLSVSYFAEDFMFHDWQDGDDDQISADGSALKGGVSAINLGSAGRNLEITKTGGTSSTVVTITGDLNSGGGGDGHSGGYTQGGGNSGQNQTGVSKQYTVNQNETFMVWDMLQSNSREFKQQ